MTSHEWWRSAAIYQVYVRSYADADGDGVGDLAGITSRLQHIRDLGADALWLTPFYTSPQKDHGYDVADYHDVDPLFGTLADFDRLLARAHDLGLKVIVDIVPNHTSSEHPWFQEALAAAPGSPARDRYLFRTGRAKGEEPPNNWPSVMGNAAWTRVGDTDQWYLHLFDSSQPDLNWGNPEVAEMFDGVLRFWLDRGVDGFRVDVAHGLIKEEDLPDRRYEEPGHDPGWNQAGVHDVYRRWRRILNSYDPPRMAVAEAWTPTIQQSADYVRPDELNQAFDFWWLSARWSAEAYRTAIRDSLETFPPVGSDPTWVMENHDVVRSTTRLGGGERGLARARAAALAMLALPGAVYVYQGEELGLPEVDVPHELRQDPAWLRAQEVTRDGCRVPLPWSGAEPPFGFGPTAGQPWLPQPDWADLTVERQTGDPDSTLEFWRTALHARRELSGELEILRSPKTVLAFRRGTLTCQVNCGTRPVKLMPGEIRLASGPVGDKLPPDTAVWLDSGED